MASFQGLHKVLDALREGQAQDAFMKHLDVCRQCESQPFNLCSSGSDLINKVLVAWDGEVCKCGELPDHCTCEKD